MKKQTEYKSTFLLTDGEILALGIRPSEVELYRRKHYQSQFGIDTWYDSPLQEFTFKTKMIPLQFDEGQAIVDKKQKKKLSDESVGLLDQVRSHISKTNNKLKTKIDDALKSDFPNGAFIKLNTRSPKDVPVYDFESPVMQKLMEDGLKEGMDDNQVTITFIKATTKAMKVQSGDEAMHLLCNSSRISEDLNKMLPFGKDLFSTNIIIREWLDDVPERPDMEFRGFVHNNQLNAVTQYYSNCYFDELVQNKETIKKQILDFFEIAKPHFERHSSYVIDFFVTNTKVYVIEINPFHNGAGAGLFSWKVDRELFLNGPFEFRILEKLVQNPMDVLPPFWVRFVNSKIRPAEEEEEEEEVEERKPLWWLFTASVLVITGAVLYRKYNANKN